jgi:hypothetical protein
MADLLDIAPSTSVEAVKISGGGRLVVHGLNGNAIASIVARFPKLASLLGAGGDNVGWHLIENFGSAIGPIIAAGCGHLGDEQREARASNLLVEDQLKLLTAILGLTFPNGFSSFIDQLTKLMSRADEGAKPVRVRLRKSPSPSPPSSDAASRPNMQ